jgi:hypothetical protein
MCPRECLDPRQNKSPRPCEPRALSRMRRLLGLRLIAPRAPIAACFCLTEKPALSWADFPRGIQCLIPPLLLFHEPDPHPNRAPQAFPALLRAGARIRRFPRDPGSARLHAGTAAGRLPGGPQGHWPRPSGRRTAEDRIAHSPCWRIRHCLIGFPAGRHTRPPSRDHRPPSVR